MGTGAVARQSAPKPVSSLACLDRLEELAQQGEDTPNNRAEAVTLIQQVRASILAAAMTWLPYLEEGA